MVLHMFLYHAFYYLPKYLQHWLFHICVSIRFSFFPKAAFISNYFFFFYQDILLVYIFTITDTSLYVCNFGWFYQIDLVALYSSVLLLASCENDSLTWPVQLRCECGFILPFSFEWGLASFDLFKLLYSSSINWDLLTCPLPPFVSFLGHLLEFCYECKTSDGFWVKQKLMLE